MSKYGRITVEGKDIPPDEPLFLLRAQDRLAANAVRAYAEDMDLWSLPVEQVAQVRAFADLMDAWPVKKTPD